MDFICHYLQIPYGNSATIAAITAPATEATFANSYCGRFFSIASGATAGVTVCCKLNLNFVLNTKNNPTIGMSFK